MEINLINRTGTICLDSSHSMILGNKPEVISNETLVEILAKEKVSEEYQHSMESFGFWEQSTPNYTTYYPDMTPDQLQPKDEEFIYPIFRALSATIVFKGYRPIDFSKAGVLEASMPLLVGQTINVDHETATGNAIGAVKSVVWQKSYTDKATGIKVPAGINAEFKIDGKSNPRLARGMMMDPPSIHSNSVSVRFKWEPSHKMDSDDDFMSKLGQRDEKNNLYRLIVTEILQYSETSVVPHGADAFAQIVKDGKIVNPVYANSVYTFSAKDNFNKKIIPSHFIDYKTDLSLSDEDIDKAIPNELNINNNNEEKQISMNVLEILEQLLSLTKGSLTEANLKGELTNWLSANVKSKEDRKLESKLSKLEAKLDKKKTELSQYLEGGEKFALIAAGEKFQALEKEQQTEASRMYKLIKGDDASEDMVKTIEGSTGAVLEQFTKDFREQLEAKFPDSCKSCGSTEINKASSLGKDDENDDKDKGRGKEKLSVNDLKNVSLNKKRQAKKESKK